MSRLTKYLLNFLFAFQFFKRKEKVSFINSSFTMNLFKDSELTLNRMQLKYV